LHFAVGQLTANYLCEGGCVFAFVGLSVSSITQNTGKMYVTLWTIRSCTIPSCTHDQTT